MYFNERDVVSRVQEKKVEMPKLIHSLRYKEHANILRMAKFAYFILLWMSYRSVSRLL